MTTFLKENQLVNFLNVCILYTAIENGRIQLLCGIMYTCGTDACLHPSVLPLFVFSYC